MDSEEQQSIKDEIPPTVPASDDDASDHDDDDDSDDDSESTEQEDDDAGLDEEGLCLEYDVVVCGTGLVQSILASALARAGKSVLHCDGADWYGELDAVWSLPMIEELLSLGDDNDNEPNNTPPPQPQPKEASTAGSDLIPLEADGSRTSLRWHRGSCTPSSSSHGKYSFGIEVGTSVKTPFGDGLVRSVKRCSGGSDKNSNSNSNNPNEPLITLEIELNKWKLADGRSPMVHVGVDASELLAERFGSANNTVDALLLEEILSRTRNIRALRSVRAETVLKQSARSLALDATPSFVLAAGRAVRGMLASGVADYLEFKTVDGLYWLESSAKAARGKKSTGRTKKASTKPEKENETNDGFALSRVPCSKNDVFGTKLLAPMEKRRFMKFIQLSMDYATKIAVEEECQQSDNEENNDESKDGETEDQGKEEVESLNERHLNQGRSLARPQNKAVDTGELQRLQEAIDDGSVGFDDFLSDRYKLSPKLRSIVRYALAWETEASGTSLEDGMGSLRKHLQALGRYGTTAFLVPLYGSGELSQAFCRSAAVFGATYLLRRAPLAVEVGGGEDSDGNENQTKRVSGIVLSIDGFLDGYSQEHDLQQQQQERKTKVIKCSRVVVPANAISKSYSAASQDQLPRKRILRRIGVFSGALVPSDNGEQRHVVFIPPGTLGNSHAIHGIILDSSVSVAPRGCTLLHLTTTIHGGEEATDETAGVLLERAQEAVLSSQLAAGAKDTDDLPIEIYSVCFSHEDSSFSVHDAEEQNATTPEGLHLCGHTGQVLTADVAFEQAEAIFSSICPGEQFLGLSGGIDKVIRERAEEKKYDNDDEKHVLESALGMIEENTAPESTET